MPAKRSPKLTQRRIVGAAIRLADADGLDAVTIRRLASELDVKPMSLYVHIATKDDLLALMMDEVVGMMLIEKPLSENWREALAEIAKREHAAYRAHPWVLEAFARGPRMGPNTLQHARQQARAVTGLGLSSSDVWTLIGILDDFVVGNATRIATRGSPEALEHLLSPGDLAVSPELAALRTADLAQASLERFEIGLATFLDVVERRFLSSPPARGQAGRTRKPRASRAPR